MREPVDSAPRQRLVAAYILAGGASRRMGRGKAELVLDGRTLVQHIAARLQAQVASVTVVGKQGTRSSGLPILWDRTTERALVHGLRTVLQAPGPAWRLVLACDMPGVTAATLDLLWGAAEVAGAPGACARTARGIEPLPSLWHADVAARIHPDWGLAAHEWIQRAGLAVVELQERPSWLANLNTPQEWAAYCDARS